MRETIAMVPFQGPSAKSLLYESNPISLRSAFILDDDQSVYLSLSPVKSSIPGSKTLEKYVFAYLYRHGKSRFAELLYVLGKGRTHEGLPEQADKAIASRKAGVLRKWFGQMVYRSFIIGHRKGVKAIKFTSPPDFKLIWEPSGQSVAVMLNGEPWAFILENKNHGYSKAIVPPTTLGNSWDQELFEKTFQECVDH